MTVLPTRAHLTDVANVKSDSSVDFGDLRDVIAELGGHESWSTANSLTIASGSVTPAAAGPDFCLIETEGGAASDYLTTIATTNRPQGREITLRMKTAGHTVIVDHAAANILLATDADFSLDVVDKYLVLRLDGTNWCEIDRCWGADKTSAEFRTFQGHGTAAALDVGTTASKVLQLNGSAQIPAVDGSLLTGLRQRGLRAKIVERQPNGTAAGTSIGATYNKRNLNDKSTYGGYDEIGITLASGQMTLPAGTYYFRATAPAAAATGHKLTLYETTATVARIVGQACRSTTDYDGNPIISTATVCGRFTIASALIFELRHYISTGLATSGLGAAVSGGSGDEIYAVIELEKVS